jgi:hypothetical protein
VMMILSTMHRWLIPSLIMLFQNPPYKASQQLMIPQIATVGTSFGPLPCQAHGYGVIIAQRVEVEVGADGPTSAPSSGTAAGAPPAGASNPTFISRIHSLDPHPTFICRIHSDAGGPSSIEKSIAKGASRLLVPVTTGTIARITSRRSGHVIQTGLGPRACNSNLYITLQI